MLYPASKPYSPPAWGWSDRPLRGGNSLRVFPTRVGMVRYRGGCCNQRGRIPHPRGDGPVRPYGPTQAQMYSPPAWGWSAGQWRGRVCEHVFPTRVGMVRVLVEGPIHLRRIPHPRGDGPSRACGRSCPWAYSPPAWGWSARQKRDLQHSQVFPTRVGMVRIIVGDTALWRRIPHPRGDGPPARYSNGSATAYSPPAWGWSGPQRPRRRDVPVFPTRVGMVRLPRMIWKGCWGIPHPRGDGPATLKEQQERIEYSPPAWGWSAASSANERTDAVFPTRVGMVRLAGC